MAFYTLQVGGILPGQHRSPSLLVTGPKSNLCHCVKISSTRVLAEVLLCRKWQDTKLADTLENFCADRLGVPSLACRHGKGQAHDTVMQVTSAVSMAASPVVLNADGARLEGPPTLWPPWAAAIAG